MKLYLISEGYGRVYGFDYDKFQQDPRPRLLLLGKWRHPNTRNLLLGGINLNYLSDEQILALRQHLPEILKNHNLKLRYRKGKKLLPEIFGEYYRTYDRDWVGSVTRDTLKFFRPDELDQAELPPEPPEPTKGPTAARPEVPGVDVPPAAPGAAPEAPEAPGEPGKAQAPAQVQKPEEPAPETQQQAPQVGQAAPAPVEPEVEKAPAGAGLRGAPEAKGGPAGAPPPGAPEAEEEPPMTSAQRRRSQAKQIKQALDQQKEKEQTPPPKPEPPDEVKGVLGMFKNKK